MEDDGVLREITLRVSPGIVVKIFDAFLLSYDWTDNMGRRPQCVLRRQTSKEIEYAVLTNGLTMGPTVEWVLVEAAVIRFEPTIGPGSQTSVQLRPVVSQSVVPVLPSKEMANMIDAYGARAHEYSASSIANVEAELQAQRASA